MKKDIDIPKVENIELAIIREFNSEFKVYDWNVYLVNQRQEVLEMVLIVINGYDAKRKTAVTRHKIEKLPAKSIAKIEYVPDELLALNNVFRISFFLNNKLHEKTFTIVKNSIEEAKAKTLNLFADKKGFIFE
jgi:hypothetical protein